MKASEICHTAAELVEGDRAATHGDMEVTFVKIAAMWSAYLGAEVTPMDVAYMMGQMKMVRAKNGKPIPDHATDVCGYAGIAGQLCQSLDPTAKKT